MAEPIAPTLASGGLVIFGIVTGLDPMLLVAGFIGCWWYNSYLVPPLPIVQRLTSALIAAIVAAWTTPPVVAWATGATWWPGHVPKLSIAFPAALAIGFLTHKVIGPGLLRIAQRKIEDAAP